MRGWRRASARDSKKRQDWAEEIKRLVDIDYPDAEKIVLVEDNLNTHRLASLYVTFPPEEARRLASKLELHYTPKHGSWLNMAETELSILSRQAFGDRMENKEYLVRQMNAWVQRRNDAKGSVNWRFTTKDARIKLRKLYPSIHVT